jgi:RNA polymerase sigma-70 factor (ECF subfamily)
MGNESHDEFLRCLIQAQPVLRRFVLARVPDFHQAEDTLQEITLVLWRKFGGFRREQSFTAWACGVARNEVLHARRAAARSRLFLAAEIAARFDARLEAAAPEFDRRRGFLQECLQRLPGRAREAIEAKYVRNQDTEQASAALGMSVNALRILLCRVRRTIDRCLDEALRKSIGEESPA